jgi:hypothetical protein
MGNNSIFIKTKENSVTFVNCSCNRRYRQMYIITNRAETAENNVSKLKKKCSTCMPSYVCIYLYTYCIRRILQVIYMVYWLGKILEIPLSSCLYLVQRCQSPRGQGALKRHYIHNYLLLSIYKVYKYVTYVEF